MQTPSAADIKLCLRTAHAKMVAGAAKRCDGRYSFARRLVASPVALTAKLSNCSSDGVKTSDVAALARHSFLVQLG